MMSINDWLMSVEPFISFGVCFFLDNMEFFSNLFRPGINITLWFLLPQ